MSFAHGCAICAVDYHADDDFTVGYPVVLVRCGHVFHVECIKRWLEGFVINAPTCPVCRAVVYMSPERDYIIRIRLQSVQESPNTVEMIDEMKKQQVKLHESLIGGMTAAAKRSEDAIMAKMDAINEKNELKQKEMVNTLSKKIAKLEKQVQKMAETAEKCKLNALPYDAQQIRHVSTQRVSTRIRRPTVKRLGMTSKKPQDISKFTVIKPTIVITIDSDETSNLNFNPQSTSTGGKKPGSRGLRRM